MTQITASLVKELRDATNLGMMECKKALVDSDGDKDKAIQLLREKGQIAQEKRAGRDTTQGVIASGLDGSKVGTLVQISCETDFVSKNEKFQGYVQEIATRAVGIEGDLGEAIADDLTNMVHEIGENIVLSNSDRYEVSGTGAIASYIHLGGRVGVLIEVSCGNDATVEQAAFAEVVKDLNLHIAACNPAYLNRDEVPADIVAAEREIYAKQVEGKPAEILDKIVDGKMNKFFAQSCLLDQGFVKDDSQSISDLLASVGKDLGDELGIRRFVRYEVG